MILASLVMKEREVKELWHRFLHLRSALGPGYVRGLPFMNTLKSHLCEAVKVKSAECLRIHDIACSGSVGYLPRNMSYGVENQPK